MNFEKIFQIQTESEFNEMALEVFQYQFKNVLVYQDFVNYLIKDISAIKHYTEIPFLPIQFFKKFIILDKNYTPKKYFQSSGTTSENLSKHYIAEPKIYEESLLKTFEKFIAPVKNCIFLGLLPTSEERPNSSLLYMVNFLMEKSQDTNSGYFLHKENLLENTLKSLQNSDKKIVLFGLTYALLDFIENRQISNKNLTIIETGGMKGRKEEITKEQVFSLLKTGFPNATLASEYGMTELFSQAYAINSLQYNSPNWMKILIRELDDPLSYVPVGKSGAINIIDLANVHSCSFIATQDMGRINQNLGFEILGRIDHSDIRGCSLMLNEFTIS